MEFIVKKSDWIRFVDVTGDESLIHRDDAAAKAAGLERVIAPGMWLASHTQRNSEIQKREFNFKNPVYDGDLIRIDCDSLYKGDDLVCKGDVVYGKPTNENISLPEGIIYSQSFYASLKNIKDFLNSVNVGGFNPNPEMYLMSLSAPTLLNYAKPRELAGIHAYQSMEICKPFDVDHVRVHVEEEKIGKRMCKFNLYWESNGEVVATGTSKVLPISI